MYAPTYLIYADMQRTSDEAKQLVDALGMSAHLEEYKTRAIVVALLDDITVPEVPDLAVNDMFGLKLEGMGGNELGGRRAMVGTLSNSKGVMIKLVALDPYGHWNFKPAADDMWTFLSRFRRDLATGALLIQPGG